MKIGPKIIFQTFRPQTRINSPKIFPSVLQVCLFFSKRKTSTLFLNWTSWASSDADVLYNPVKSVALCWLCPAIPVTKCWTSVWLADYTHTHHTQTQHTYNNQSRVRMCRLWSLYTVSNHVDIYKRAHTQSCMQPLQHPVIVTIHCIVCAFLWHSIRAPRWPCAVGGAIIKSILNKWKFVSV